MRWSFWLMPIFMGMVLWSAAVSAQQSPLPVAVSLGFLSEGDVPVAALDHASDILRAEAATTLGAEYEVLQPSTRSDIPVGTTPAVVLSGTIEALPTGGYRMRLLLEGAGAADATQTNVAKALAPWVMAPGERELLEKQVRLLAEELFKKGLGIGGEEPAMAPAVASGPTPLAIPGTPDPTPDPTPAPVPSPPADFPVEDPAGAATAPIAPEAVQAASAPAEEEDSSFESFVMGRLYSMRHVKPPTANEWVSFGAHLRIAPVKALVKSQVENLKNEYPEVGAAIEVIEQVDPEELDGYLDAVANARGTLDEYAEYLEESGLSQEDQKLIRDLTENGESLEQLRTVIDIVRDPEKAVTFTLEPYFTINLDPIAITGALPLAGFAPAEGDTEFALGNATIDLRLGHHFGTFGSPVFGLSYGVTTNLPSGTERADSLAFSSMLDAPRYLHSYLGLEPYLILGLDVPFLLIQAEISFVDLIGVRDGAEGDRMYMKYGAGLSIVPTDFISLTAEIAGAFEVENASQFDVHMVTAGLRYSILGVEVGAAVQLPIAQPGPEAYDGFGGVSFGSPADFNALLRVDAAF